MPHTQVSLVTEEIRKSITAATDIVYLDPATNVPVISGISSKIEITVLLGTTEANGVSLREFGLFGGTATGDSDSGQMVNWVTHSKIDKDSSFGIERKIRIEFLTQTP
jgi:hypothetical protein